MKIFLFKDSVFTKYDLIMLDAPAKCRVARGISCANCVFLQNYCSGRSATWFFALHRLAFDPKMFKS